MPIKPVKPIGYIEPLTGANQLASEIDAGINPFEPNTQPASPWLNELWNPHARTGITAGVMDWALRPGGQPDQRFNPFQFIKDSPQLANDPIVTELVNRGQFDGSKNIDMFMYDLSQGRSMMDDLETISRGGFFGNTLTGFVQTAPAMALPLGAVGNGAGLIKTLAVGAGTGAAFNYANKLALNQLLPATNEPGAADEVGAITGGAAFGAGFGLVGHLASPMYGGVQRAMSREKIADVKNQWIKAGMDSLGPGAVKVGDPSMLPMAGENIGKVLRGVYDEGTARLDELTTYPAFDHAQVQVLMDGGVNAAKLETLRLKYKEAGLTLHELPHPQQVFYDLVRQADRLFDSPGMNKEATAEDFGYGKLNSAAANASTVIARAISKITPGGKLASVFTKDITLGRLQDALRLVSASEQTLVTGSVRHSDTFNAGIPAEQMRTDYQKKASSARTAMEQNWADARRNDPAAKDWTHSQYWDAIENVRRVKDAQSHGHAVEMPDYPAFVTKGADVAKKYYNAMRDDLEGVGMLSIGPRSIANTEAELSALNAQITKHSQDFARAQTDHSNAVGKGLMGTPDEAGVRTAKAEMDAASKGLSAAKDKHAETYEKLQSLKKSYATSQEHNPQVWDHDAIRANQEGYIRDLSRAFREADTTGPNGRLSEDVQPINPKAIKGLESELTVLAASKKGVPLTNKDIPTEILKVGDLPAATRAIYEDQLAAHYRKAAVEAMNHIIDDPVGHGATDGFTKMPDALKSRVLRVNQENFRQWLVNDTRLKLQRYDYALSGQMAIRRAIQLNPETWAGKTLFDGTPVTDIDTLKSYISESLEANKRIGARQDIANGTEPMSPKSLQYKADRLKQTVETKFFVPLDEIAGRRPISSPDSLRWVDELANTATSLTTSSKLGSASLASINDFAPLALNAMANPHAAREMLAMMRHVKELGYGPDIEALGMASDHLARSHNMSEQETLNLSMDTGKLAAIRRGATTASDFVHKWSGLEWLTNFQKRAGFVSVMNDAASGASKIIRLAEAKAGGMAEDGALRKAGLSKVEAAQLNQLGLNAARAKHLLELLHEHGDVKIKGEWVPIKDVADKNAYVGGERIKQVEKAPVRPNFGKWNKDVSTKVGSRNKDLYDVLGTNITARVERQSVVTPGRFDKPILNRTWWGKMANTFQSFLMAFSNQRLRVMAQLPAKDQLTNVGTYLMLGAISKAISDHISGRRSFDDTIKAWQEKPEAAIYEAWGRSGLSSWMERPMAIGDALGVPWAPGNLTGANLATTSARHMESGRAMGLISPTLADAWQALNVGADVASGRADQRTAYNAARLIPGQNLIWLRLLNKITGLPIVPEAIKPLPKSANTGVKHTK